MKITKTTFNGTTIKINKLTYVNALYISKTLKDNDSKINYKKTIKYNSIIFFMLCK